MTIPTTEHQARLDGIVAAKRGVSFLDNPFPLGCSLSRSWSRGWRATQTKDATMFDFGHALRALKIGERVARQGWNGKGMFVYVVPAASYPAQTGAAKAHFGEDAMVPYNAYLALKGADNTVSTWAPSGSDALAEDWMIVD